MEAEDEDEGEGSWEGRRHLSQLWWTPSPPAPRPPPPPPSLTHSRPYQHIFLSFSLCLPHSTYLHGLPSFLPSASSVLPRTSFLSTTPSPSSTSTHSFPLPTPTFPLNLFPSPPCILYLGLMTVQDPVYTRHDSPSCL